MAKKMEHDKYAVYIIFLVAIVGVVAVGAIISDAQSGNLVGEAFKKLKGQGDGTNSAGLRDKTDLSSAAGAADADGEQEAAQEVCEDSDGGIVFETQGTTSGLYGTVPGTSSYTDYCIQGGIYNGQIAEYHCVGDYVQYHHYDCPAGEECADGECALVQQQGCEAVEIGEGFYPDVYGDYVAWYANDGNDYEIYLYQISTGTTTQITDYSYYHHPNIDGDYAVWYANDGSGLKVYYSIVSSC